MLAAYVDDSGSQGEGPVFVLGGYVANTDQWKGFSGQWQIALDLAPKLEVVKIQHALRLEEGWGRFREKERDERMKRFASIIHRHAQFSIVVSSSWNDIRRIQTEFFAKNKAKFLPYNMLFHGLMSTLVHHLKYIVSQERVDFIFDEQGQLGRMALDQFDYIRSTLPSDLAAYIGGRPIHGDDEEILPLQAAHTIAWLVRRYAHDHNLTDDLSSWKPKQPYLKKLGKIPFLYSWFPYERLAPVIMQAMKERGIPTSTQDISGEEN